MIDAHLVHVFRDTKQDYTLQSLSNQRGQKSLELVDTPAFLSRQAVDDLLGIGIVRDKDGVHEH